jgi:hypothetical protein
MHGAVAELRDFNYPACVYHRVTGSYPDNAFGLPNFMNNAYFTDYNHPMEHGYTLEEVYPSMFGRVKDEACQTCVVEPVCPGITGEWRKQGYEVRPVDESAYLAQFPRILLSKVLQGVLWDPLRIEQVLALDDVDWLAVQRLLFARLAQGAAEARLARENILSFSPEGRAGALCEILRGLGYVSVALTLESELERLDQLAASAAAGVEQAPDEASGRPRRLPLVS